MPKKTNGNGGAAVPRGERIAIVAGLRTPFAKQGTAYRDLSALDLGKLVVAELLARSELDSEGGRPRRLRAGRPLAQRSEHRARDRARHRDAEGHRGLQREPRVRDALPGDDQRRRGDARRAARRRDRRRRRQRERRPASPSRRSSPTRSSRRSKARTLAEKLKRVREALAAGLPARAAGAQGADDRAHDGRERREDGQGERHRARGAGRVRAPQPHARRAGVGGRHLRRRGDARHPAAAFDEPIAEDNLVRKDSTLEGYAQAEAGVRPQVRHDHGGQLVAAHRRRERAPPDDASRRRKALGYKPLGYLQVVGLRGARSRRLAAHGAELRDAEGARPRRAHAQGHGPRRHARGVRRAGALQREGVRLEEVRRGEARPQRGDRRDRRREVQRERRLDRHRPPVRGDGRAHGDHRRCAS